MVTYQWDLGCVQGFLTVAVGYVQLTEMKSKILSNWVVGSAVMLWIALVGTSGIVAGCEEEPPSIPRGGVPPTPQKVEPTPASPAEKPTPEAEKPTAKPSNPPPAAAPPRSAKNAPSAARPTTIVPVAAAACGVATGLQLGQELDFGWAEKNEKVRVQITRPRSNEILRTGSLRIAVRLVGFRTEAQANGRGNRLRVFLDNERSRDWFDANDRSMTIDGLAAGLHSIRVVALTPWGETIKAKNAFDAVSFYVRTDKDQPPPVDFSKPVLSYSEPHGVYSGAAAERILLDFHVANTTLQPDGNRVQVVLDGTAMDLTAWGPLWIEAIPEGDHAVVMSLLDKDGKPIHGPYNNKIERRFTVQRAAKK